MKNTKWNNSEEGGTLKGEKEFFMTKIIFVKMRLCVSVDQSDLDSSRDN